MDWQPRKRRYCALVKVFAAAIVISLSIICPLWADGPVYPNAPTSGVTYPTNAERQRAYELKQKFDAELEQEVYATNDPTRREALYLLQYQRPPFGVRPADLDKLTPEQLNLLRSRRDEQATVQQRLFREQSLRNAKDNLEKFRRTRDPESYRVYRKWFPPTKEDIPELLKLLEDRSEGIRGTAAWCLGNIGPDARSVVPKLVGRCREERLDSPVVREAIAAFGNIGPQASAATPYLVELFKKHEEVIWLRRGILKSWRQMGSGAKEATPVLEAELAGIEPEKLSDVVARDFMRIALYYSDMSHGGGLDEHRKHHVLLSEMHLALGSMRNDPPLSDRRLLERGVEALEGKDSYRAFQTLRDGNLTNDQKFGLMKELLTRQQPLHVHMSVFEFVMGVERTPASLDFLLRFSEETVAKAAFMAAHQCCESNRAKDLLPVLLVHLDTDSTRAYKNVLFLLPNHERKTALPVVVKILRDCFAAKEPDHERIVACFDFIRAMPRDETVAYPFLLSLLKKPAPAVESGYRVNILQIMVATHIDEQAIPAVVKLLATAKRQTTIAIAARAAGALPSGGEKCMPHLIHLLREEYSDKERPLRKDNLAIKTSYAIVPLTTARAEVIHAIAAIGGKEAQAALPYLRALANDEGSKRGPKSITRRAAAEAVANLSK